MRSVFSSVWCLLLIAFLCCSCGCCGAYASAPKLTLNLQLGKGLVDLAPLRGPNTPTMLGGKLIACLKCTGYTLDVSYRHPFYDGGFWDQAFSKFECGVRVPLRPCGPAFFARYERNPSTGGEWGWFGVDFPLLR
jgi:hypothetical protein